MGSKDDGRVRRAIIAGTCCGAAGMVATARLQQFSADQVVQSVLAVAIGVLTVTLVLLHRRGD